MKLREYQIDAVSSVNDAIDNGNKKIAVVVPTAGGKTLIFGKIIKDYIENNQGKRAVVISHLGLLTKQTGSRFKSDWDMDSEVLQAEQIPSGNSDCIITTMQSFRSEYKIKQWARNIGSFSKTVKSTNVGMIVIDEAHYMGSESYDKIICMFPDAIIIGFTATPFRGNKLMTDMFDTVAYTISMSDLIEKKYLVAPRLNITRFNTADPADLYSGILKIIKMNEGKKAVVYLKTIAESEECRNVLIQEGISCSSITSKFTGQARDDVLESYKNGVGPDVLTTVDVLTAGFDSPNLSIIIMPYKVSSVTTYLQRVGRGLRLFEGKEFCDVYVGGKNPKLDAGFWERITKKMLKQGKKEYDNYLDDFDYLKDDLTGEELSWTIDVINMAKAVKTRDMKGLYESIIQKKFPTDLLESFIDMPPVVMSKKLLGQPITDRQFGYLKSMGIDATGLSKGEAMSTISTMIKISGKHDKRDLVPSGKYKGYFYNEVPRSYWSMMAGSFGGRSYGKTGSGLLLGYKQFKDRNRL